MMQRSDYDGGQTIGKGPDGRAAIVKGKTNSPAGGATQSDGLDYMLARHAHERHELHNRQSHEHLQMHARHELAHRHHEITTGGRDKKALHERHEAELAEMYKKYHAEHVAMHDRHRKELGGAK